jgi:hypothetical protein
MSPVKNGKTTVKLCAFNDEYGSKAKDKKRHSGGLERHKGAAQDFLSQSLAFLCGPGAFNRKER